MFGDSKGTWCELPDEGTQPQDGSSLPYGNEDGMLQKSEESIELGGDNLLVTQAEESKKKKEELPLAVASLSRDVVRDYTGKKEKKRGSWPWWAKVMCVLLILLLGLAIWTVAALTRLAHQGANTPLQSISQNKQLEEPFATDPPTWPPTLAPTVVPTLFPTASLQTGTPQAIVADDDFPTPEECDDGFLMGLGCFWMWLLLG